MAVIDIVQSLQKIKEKLNNSDYDVWISISSNGYVIVWIRHNNNVEIIGHFHQDALTIDNVLTSVLLKIDKINKENEK